MYRTHSPQAWPWPSLLLTAATLAGLAGLSGCLAGADEPVSFRIALAFDAPDVPRRPQSCGPCSQYSATCGGILSIRIADPSQPERLRHRFLTEQLPPSANVCEAMSRAEVDMGRIPVGMARVEVTIWGIHDQPLNRPIYDLQGQPRTDVKPAPAMGGAVYFDIGTEPELIVPISCVAPETLAGCAGTAPALEPAPEPEVTATSAD